MNTDQNTDVFAPLILSNSEMCKALSCSRESLSGYVSRGICVQNGRSQYDFWQTLPLLLQALRTANGSASLESARIENLQANTRKNHLEIARAEGELIDAVANQEIQRQIVFQFGVFLTTLPDILVRASIIKDSDSQRLVDVLNAERQRLVAVIDGVI